MDTKVYKDDFDNWQDVKNNFEIEREEPQYIFAIYDNGGYDGWALVIFSDDGLNFFTVEGSHCSCYGLEGQWEPETTTFAALHHMATEASYGGFYNHSAEILAWLTPLDSSNGEPHGHINKWHLHGNRIYGTLVSDRKGRFPENSHIHTSQIVKITVETANSIYTLGEPA